MSLSLNALQPMPWPMQLKSAQWHTLTRSLRSLFSGKLFLSILPHPRDGLLSATSRTVCTVQLFMKYCMSVGCCSGQRQCGDRSGTCEPSHEASKPSAAPAQGSFGGGGCVAWLKTAGLANRKRFGCTHQPWSSWQAHPESRRCKPSLPPGRAS